MPLNLKSDRRAEERPESPERRRTPRPPLWLNLSIFLLAAIVFLISSWHRRALAEDFQEVLASERTSPVVINEVKDELAKMDLTEEQLRRELQAREQLIANLDDENFYLALDTGKKTLMLQYADQVLREMPVEAGAQREIEGKDGKVWTFVPLKGAFEMVGKSYSPSWQVQEWVYLMKGEEVPSSLPTIKGGIGRYVIELPNDYVIHTAPSEDSPLDGVKPGSFMVSESDMRAIWPRIGEGTKIYIY